MAVDGLREQRAGTMPCFIASDLRLGTATVAVRNEHNTQRCFSEHPKVSQHHRLYHLITHQKKAMHIPAIGPHVFDEQEDREGLHLH